MTPSSPRSSTRSPVSGADLAAAQADGERPATHLLRRALVALAALALVAGLGAYVRIRVDGTTLYWQDPSGISWRWSAAGSDDVEDGSDALAVARAFASWEAAPGSRAAFFREVDTLSRDWAGPTHLVLFDEDGSTGWFPPSAGVVALTPLSYATSDGRILDADVIFNGRDYAFSTDGTPGSFDIQDVATHEIGHLLGLDHVPLPDASLWPWVAAGEWRHRSPSSDDRAGAAALAPRGDPGRLLGTVVDAQGTAISGARVSALSLPDHTVAASVLTRDDGRFTLRGVEPGDYLLHVAPVGGAFSAANLTGNTPMRSDFGAFFFGGWAAPTLLTVSNGVLHDVGLLTAPPQPTLTESLATARQLRPGESDWVLVPVSGAPAGTTVEARGPWLSIGAVQQYGNVLRCETWVAAGAPPGAYDLYLRTPAGELTVAGGAVEVIAPEPRLDALQPYSGSPNGGEIVTLHGDGFQPDGWVLFGGVEAQAVEFIDVGTLRATLPPAAPAQVDVTVLNPDGQETRLAEAFRFTATPTLDSLVPVAGQATGGSRILLQGAWLGAATEVLLDGVPLAVEVLGGQVLRATTPAHAPGAVTLELRNPDSPPLVVPDAFTYVEAPDPVVTRFTPDRGSRRGGTRVALRGDGLGGTVQVRFGVDSASGTGGAPGSELTVLGDGEVQATTGGVSSPGSYGVLVTTATGQGTLVTGFVYDEENRAGAGCGGVIRGGAPPDPLSGLLELALLPAAWWLTRRRRPRTAVAGIPADASAATRG